MKGKLISFTIVVLSLMCSCSTQETKCSELLLAVPSDAIAIGSFSSVAQARAVMMPANDPLSLLDLGTLARNDAVVAVTYNASLTHLLCLDVGKAASEPGEELLLVMAMAEAAGIGAELIQTGSRNTLVLTRSESILAEIKRHADASSSILDAPFFKEALSGQRETGVVYLRGSGLKRLFPPLFRPYLQNGAEWLCLASADPVSGSWDVRVVSDGSPVHYASMVAEMPSSSSRLKLPIDSEYAVDMIVSEEFRGLYENYKDANNKLASYRNHLKEVSGKGGCKALDWEKLAAVKEISLVSWNGHSVLLARTRKDIAPYPGLLSALYGKVFSLEDESCYERYGEWFVIGSESDVAAWIAAEKEVLPEGWNTKGVKLQILCPQLSLSVMEEVVKLNITKT